jgi:hypothetical protein
VALCPADLVAVGGRRSEVDRNVTRQPAARETRVEVTWI